MNEATITKGESLLPEPTVQGIPRLFHQGGDLPGPAGILASEEANRRLQGSARVMQGESAAPSPRDVGEVFLGEGPRGQLDLVVGHGELQRHTAKMSQEGGGIEDRVGFSKEVEINECKAVTLQQDVIRRQIPMGRA